MSNTVMIGNKNAPMMCYGPDSLSCMRNFKTNKNSIIQRCRSRLTRVVFEEPYYINAIKAGIEAGFRIIDFSASYGDGSLIAKGIKKTKVKREDIILTTRITNRAQYNDNIENEFMAQLKGFETDYFDILMFHWPVTDHYEQTWLKLIELKSKGLCKMIGVANCNIHHLQRLYEVSGVYPEINQVEIHPLFSQIELREFCKTNNIILEAYSPTARQDDRLVNPPLLNILSKKYSKSITQLILKWHVQNGVIPVIRSMNPDHLKANIDIFDFEISDEDMKKIDGLNINSRMRYDPDNCDFTAL